MTVRFLTEAEEEMMEAAVFYQEQAEGLARDLLMMWNRRLSC